MTTVVPGAHGARLELTDPLLRFRAIVGQTVDRVE